MIKRAVSRNELNFIKKEMKFCFDNSIITSEQYDNILEMYETRQGLNFIRIVLTIGAVLVGLGIISFIASNWYALNNASRFGILIMLYCLSTISSMKTYYLYPKTSKSLLYLSILIFGSSIFLIGQMFNFGGDFSQAFFLWAIGTLPYAFLFKDYIVYFFSNLLLFIYINSLFSLGEIPILLIIILMSLYYLNRYLDHSMSVVFINNILTLNIILYMTSRWNIAEFYVCVIFLSIGFLMYYLPVKRYEKIFKLHGNVVIGIAGLALTYSSNWNAILPQGSKLGTTLSIVFAIAFSIYLLAFVRKGSIISLIFICITVLRFYFDAVYDFLPKSLFFIIGGVMLLIIGYFFERLRKRSEGKNE